MNVNFECNYVRFLIIKQILEINILKRLFIIPTECKFVKKNRIIE